MNEDQTVKDYLAKNGRKGGNATKERHGKDHFKRISRLALEKRWGKKDTASA